MEKEKTKKEDLKETKTKKEEKKTVSKKASEDKKGGRPKRRKSFRRNKKRDNFDERVVSINRIAKTVKGGRRMRFSALVVVGDPSKHLVGFGTAKSLEVPDAIKKAFKAARKNLFKVAIAKGDTIPYEVSGEFGAVKVFMKPGSEGTGVIAGGPVRAVFELAGIKNVYSKVYGSRTPINIVRAVIDGIEKINKINKAASLRGKKPENLITN